MSWVAQMDFDTEKFIEEVQKRPALWNKNCSEYADRGSKNKIWAQLAKLFQGDSPTEKRKEYARLLQKRWRNIRDSFIKAHKFKNTQYGKTGKKKRLYMFYDKLLFLQETACKHESCTTERNDSETSDSSQSTDFNDEPKRKKRKSNQEDLVDRDLVLNRNTVDDDDDRLFFLSLVKEFKKIPDHCKIQTKLDILKVIRDAQFGDSLNTTWVSNNVGFPASRNEYVMRKPKQEVVQIDGSTNESD